MPFLFKIFILNQIRCIKYLNCAYMIHEENKNIRELALEYIHENDKCNVQDFLRRFDLTTLGEFLQMGFITVSSSEIVKTEIGTNFCNEIFYNK